MTLCALLRGSYMRNIYARAELDYFMLLLLRVSHLPSHLSWDTDKHRRQHNASEDTVSHMSL